MVKFVKITQQLTHLLLSPSREGGRRTLYVSLSRAKALEPARSTPHAHAASLTYME